ncbi:MAG: sugar kinase [Caulobacteraceae bacterium]|nr:sugar kinase [Caulobacteraceae bacterium]
MRVVAIGECMVELRDDGQDRYARGFAGDAYNVAVYLKRTAPAAEVEFLTATGDGRLSQEMRAAWAAEGISDAMAYVAPGYEPGLYMIELDARGERGFHYWRSASAARRWLSLLEADGGAERLAGADIVYLSGISLAILSEPDRIRALGLLRALKRRVGVIAFDLNVRPQLWAGLNEARAAMAPVLAIADVVRASRDDVERLFGVTGSAAQVQALRAAGAAEIALTLDADGCLVLAGGEVTALEPPREVTVVDTTGAGDCFNGVYLARRALGDGAIAAAQAALAVAARKVGWSGAIAPVEVTHPKERAP